MAGLYDLSELCEKYYRAYRDKDSPYNYMVSNAITGMLVDISGECAWEFSGLPDTEQRCIVAGVMAIIRSFDPDAQFHNPPNFNYPYRPDSNFLPQTKKRKPRKVEDDSTNEF